MKAVIGIIRRQEQQRLAIRLLGAALFAGCLLVRPLTRHIHAAPSSTAIEPITPRKLRAVNIIATTANKKFVQEDLSTSIQEVNDRSSVVVVFDESGSTDDASQKIIEKDNLGIDQGAVSVKENDDGDGQEAINLR
jgi:hypothetical protein